VTISHKTTARQLGSILLLLRVAPMTLTMPMMIGMPSSQGLWIAAIAATVISVPLVAWMAALCRAEGLDDVVLISRRLLGTIVGSAVGWLFVLYWLIVAAFELRSVSEAYVTGAMPETPILVLMALTALVSAGIARRGIRLVAMMSELIALLILISVLLTMVLPMDVIQLRNLLPVLPEGLRPLALPTATAVTLFLDMAVLMMIAPSMTSGRGLMHGTIWSVLVSGATLASMLAVINAVFGPISTALELPVLSLTRIISIGGAVERLELITMVSWSLGVGLVLAILLWAVAVASARLLNLKCYEPLVYPLGGLMVFLAIRMWPDVGNFDRTVTGISGGLVTSLFILAVLAILTAVRWLKRRTDGDSGCSGEDRKARNVAAIVALGLMISLSTGCWSRREIETLGFVVATGIDTSLGATHWDGAGSDGDPGQRMQCTVQIMKPNSITSGERGPSLERPFWGVAVTGRTIMECLRRLSEVSPRVLYWPHNRWLVLGEEYAKGGVARILDFWQRDQETRLRTFVGVVAGGRAWDLFQAEFELERTPSEGGRKAALNVSQRLSIVALASINDFAVALASEGIDPLALRVEIIPYTLPYEVTGDVVREEVKATARLTGAAVFRGDRLVGWLDGRETRGYNWVVGKVKSALIVVEAPERSARPDPQASLIGLEIIRAKGAFKPKITDDGRNIGIVVTISAEANMADVQPYVDSYTDSDLWTFLERQLEEEIKSEAMAAIRKAQGLRADVFGFGREVYRANPRVWKQVKDQWYDMFSEIEPEIEVSAKLVRSGLRVRSVEMGEMGGAGEGR
jgi:spore germination protein KC